MEPISRQCLERIVRIYANNPAARRAAGPVLDALRELHKHSRSDSVTPCSRWRDGIAA
jgi:hypothetical protein